MEICLNQCQDVCWMNFSIPFEGRVILIEVVMCSITLLFERDSSLPSSGYWLCCSNICRSHLSYFNSRVVSFQKLLQATIPLKAFCLEARYLGSSSSNVCIAIRSIAFLKLSLKRQFLCMLSCMQSEWFHCCENNRISQVNYTVLFYVLAPFQ